MLTENDFKVTSMYPHRVLLAVDDDDDISSQKAFNYACTIAKMANLPLAIVSVLETGDMNIFQSLSPDVLDQRRAEISAHLDTYLAKAKEFGVENAEKRLGEGRPEHVLLDTLIPDFEPDLIVLGSHHHRVGHVAAAVVRESTASVIVVR
ncbi:universal stress protein [Secundilactobacillus similis]|jgi:nucleotide-binding universal stress UspA family protein|uniref:Universal stress protein, UspA family n=1 Tax=Secundilactobacillus similis DSM 23365 = JCM 2765 TaxID=1423804 RepID=A0A0R2FQA1_9LACO|nr:universal stress protein [Secundilactobacillus similis]KRN26612.1 universal stress protein, UspA family [Secundilactobacillus similis DSM 23365 = JCM 2765]